MRSCCCGAGDRALAAKIAPGAIAPQQLRLADHVRHHEMMCAARLGARSQSMPHQSRFLRPQSNALALQARHAPSPRSRRICIRSRSTVRGQSPFSVTNTTLDPGASDGRWCPRRGLGSGRISNARCRLDRDRYYVKNYNAGAGLSDCGNRRTVAIVRPDSLKTGDGQKPESACSHARC
jgi:hypothetical protein